MSRAHRAALRTLVATPNIDRPWQVRTACAHRRILTGRLACSKAFRRPVQVRSHSTGPAAEPALALCVFANLKDKHIILREEHSSRVLNHPEFESMGSIIQQIARDITRTVKETRGKWLSGYIGLYRMGNYHDTLRHYRADHH